MSISMEGIGEVMATFWVEKDSEVKPGDVVCLTGDNQVGLGQSGDIPCGVAATVAEDGCVGVVIGGLTEVAYSGSTALKAGWNKLSADGKGGVNTAGEMNFLVVSVDPVTNTAVVKL